MEQSALVLVGHLIKMRRTMPGIRSKSGELPFFRLSEGTIGV
jgi:hypothetical protein